MEEEVWNREGRSGEQHPNHKLTHIQVDEIRQRYKPYKVSLKKLADEYGVSPSTVYGIVKGESWAEPPHILYKTILRKYHPHTTVNRID